MDKLIKLFNEEKYEKILRLLLDTDEASVDYYEKIILKIKTLVKLGRFEKAKEIVNDELSMPYIESSIEERLKQLKFNIKSNQKTDNKLVIVEKEMLNKTLFFNHDINKSLKLISYISKLNVSSYLDILEKYLTWEEGEDKIKSAIMYMLKESRIQGKFRVIKNDIEYFFNPTKLINTNETEEFLFASNIINKSFFQEVSKQEIAKNLIFEELFVSIPKKNKKSELINLTNKIIKKVEASFNKF